MPQLEIEYTANLIDLDSTQVLRAAVGALSDLGEFDMAATKARIRVAEEFSVDHPDSGGSFVAITVGILPGRSEETRRHISQALTDAVAAVIPQRPGTQVTTEIRVMDAYTKVIIPEQ